MPQISSCLGAPSTGVGIYVRAFGGLCHHAGIAYYSITRGGASKDMNILIVDRADDDYRAN